MICTIKRPIVHIPENGQAAISAKGQYWKNGEVIDIYLYPSMMPYKDQVITVCQKWLAGTSLDFAFTSHHEYADIRVDFKRGGGSWSYVGTDCLLVSKRQPTMQIGWEGLDVIYHEFGHALGFLHEHQNPDGGIQWNEPVVLRELAKPPNNWDELTIRHNVLNSRNPNSVDSTNFDPTSVMLYFFPASWTLNGIGTKANPEPSATDLQHIKNLYPKPVEEKQCKEMFKGVNSLYRLKIRDLKKLAARVGVSGEGSKLEVARRIIG